MTTRQDPSRGREAQRRRTRRAIVDATRALLGEGRASPTVDAVAEAAEVSRRTVYLHFPTLDQLLLDAALGALSDAYVGTALGGSGHASPGTSLDVRDRVEAVADAVLALAPATLPLGRQIIRLTVTEDTEDTEDTESPGPRRGQRRVEWIETAVERLRDRLSDEQHERLVSGLAVLIGFESMVVLRDVRGLDAETEHRVTTWAVRALVDAILAENLAENPAQIPAQNPAG